ncbi:hypothetical protein [Caulobacter mirabilis]|uniref:DUF2987 domain-containing protein n=1 Tax=Caulobacter mirabilis TaxID=69666 RepID=A0A2D2B146_9CAUL|nr:hypothetical protein [Caulobacter mirabilis]ATQ43952.1 hypothetical protein CSW64_16915 [Caulobacter mirabilis]
MILSAAAFAAAPVLARAADKGELVPAKKIFPFYDLYLGIPAAERSRFAMAYYLMLNGKPTAGHTLWLVGAGGARTALPVGADGRIQKLPSLADLKANATVDPGKRQDSDKFQISMEMQPLVQLDTELPAADLAAAIEQCNAAIRKKAGLIGFAAPKMEQVVFVGASGGQAVLAGGKTVPLPVMKGLPVYQPAALAGAQVLKFAKAPTRALLAEKSKG